ncbi:hypothetical protein [Pseudoduganella namucuonensis]|uniref:Uncharacterized protein n=1 Tax=Pseudoduganella namucuonensis TaxID=1035707 RepID=A0A1I7M5F0_9BURK|nr:hypothetical protein [Pseudoduganella namucuonensis]SFV17171.1 hypothetical protein SAMN05216552_106017 [Pseudoduganella namucuonensis]
MKYKFSPGSSDRNRIVTLEVFWDDYKPRLHPTDASKLDDFSNHVHLSMTSLQQPTQDELTSILQSLKVIADNAAKILYFEFGMPNCKTFFSPSVDPFDLLATISSFKTVQYKTAEEANSADGAIFWPGGGTVVSEYRVTDNARTIYIIDPDWGIPEAWDELSNQLQQHVLKWKNDVIDENPKTDPYSSIRYRWMIAIDKKNKEFMSKVNHIKAALPEISIAMENWANSLAERIIDQQNYEDFRPGHDEGIDTQGFE